MLATKVEHAEIQGKTITQSFDIGDPAMIIEFMSKTIYSNPLKVAIQEYSTNARDAHIEVGREHLPITIVCPNRFDPMLKICDNGTGIDPVRMKEVFLRYGISTKRKENKSSGGFGVGCKSWISYTDTFNIRTIANENGNLVLRNYAVIKEVGKSPRLIEFGNPQIIDATDPNIPEEDKQTGTIISATIKQEDFDACKNHIIDITKFWKVRPVIKGCSPELSYPEFKWAYEGPNWKIGFDSDNYYANSFICIDGIPYPINRNAINDLSYSMGVSDLCKTNFVLFFEVGELSVSLSRESLQYDENTKKAIVQRLVEMKSWLNKNLQSQIEKSKTLWDAVVLYKKLNSVFSANTIVGDVYWNKIKVHTDNIYCQFGTCRKYFIENHLLSQKIKSKREYSIAVEENSVFTVCDDPKLYLGKIATLIDQNPGKDIYVYTPDQTDPSALANFKAKIIGFDFYNPIYLSTVVKKKMPRIAGSANPTPRSPKYQMKDTKIITQTGTSYSNGISYKADSGYYTTEYRYSLNNQFFTAKSQIETFLKLFAPTESVYIIKHKYINKLNDKFIHINELVKKIFNEEIDKFDIQKYFMKDNNKRYCFGHGNSYQCYCMKQNLNKLDNTFLKDWIDLSDKYKFSDDKKSDEQLKIETLILIGNKLGDSRVLDNGINVDTELKRYSELFDEKINVLNVAFKNHYYWNFNNVNNAPKLRKIMDSIYLDAVNKIFVDSTKS
jgi:hypothetical protein